MLFNGGFKSAWFQICHLKIWFWLVWTYPHGISAILLIAHFPWKQGTVVFSDFIIGWMFCLTCISHNKFTGIESTFPRLFWLNSHRPVRFNFIITVRGRWNSSPCDVRSRGLRGPKDCKQVAHSPCRYHTDTVVSRSCSYGLYLLWCVYKSRVLMKCSEWHRKWQA